MFNQIVFVVFGTNSTVVTATYLSDLIVILDIIYEVLEI